ncbi:iron complex transport system permease protein [Diaminobutyricimonas aerilata]|uniref:Iron complex transport system permease protein n=1 Tax=Diaminobutyricimonas aerilata TaxID=1162967 RepID=A0A2M9CFA3_9MICO|nr:iron ABC transporter permease [Diaminobutyricimonas aerilata]PJJ70611.1 iron complex transport system permease protein [Diaminobutyricimonas aerilata]
MTLTRSRVGWGLPALILGVAVLLPVMAAVHLTQGTAAVGLAELWALLTGAGVDQSADVLIASRIPRLLAGLVVGVALGAAGAAMQSASRNPLASPDTLAVNAGAHLAVVAVAAFGLSIPVLPSALVAFVGGLAAAALVLAVSGGGSGPVRLVLAGSAIALGTHAVTSTLLLLFAQETSGLYAWGQGNLAQIGLTSVTQMAPVVAVGVVLLLLLGRRLDILGLGDDAARSVGVDPRGTRVAAVVVAVLLSAAAVTVAGPVGFVGLAAPAITRLLAARIRGLAKHRALVPMSAAIGVVIVLGADVVVRALLGAQAGVEVPTGVVTTLLGAVFLVAIAFRVRDSGSVETGASLARVRSRAGFLTAVGVLVVVTVAVLVAAVLLGDAKLLLGDVANWIAGRAGDTTQFILNTRVPRVLAALLGGAALAFAGAIVQAVSRNALAEPGILGVAGGGGLAAIAVLTAVPLASAWAVTGSALLGSAAAATLVFGLAARGGLQQNRLVLIGIGVSAALLNAISMVIVLTDPFNETKALTWLSGSTYGRTFPSLLPLVLSIAIAVPLLVVLARRLDLLSLDDDTPRLLGVRLPSSRLALLSLAVLLTATTVGSLGVISFVGLVAPHAARALVGGRHSRVLPTAALLGGALVCFADTIGRTVIAPGQLPAGLVTALVGAPYFAWLLWRSRTASV